MNDIAVKENFKWFAKTGYAARGVIYLIVGGLAVLAAFGQGGETTDSKGAFMTVMNQPFGNVLVFILVVGLLGYSSWRFVQAIKDTDNHGTGAKGIAVRGGLFVSSVTHLFLAGWGINLLMGDSGGSSQGAGGFLSSELGQWTLAIAGVAVIGAGVAHLYKGWTAHFEPYMNIPSDKDYLARPICRFGLIARGVVWCIVGGLFINAALVARDGDVKGISDALHYIQNSAYGPWLLAVVAAGLFAFGVYSVLESAYRKIDTSSV